MTRWFARWALLLPALLAPTLGQSAAWASNKYLEIPNSNEVEHSKAHGYANLTNDEAFRELTRRGIGYVRATPPQPGVRAPVRLTGPLHGVEIHSTLPEEQRKDTPFEILDARLALALDDFCRILALHDVVEVVHFTMYRPAQVRADDPNGPQTRHPGGLAIDVGALRKRSGQWLSVGPSWPAKVGAKTCGLGGRTLSEIRGRELISILCEAADQRLFHYMLTPHFNPAHADHWHLEIKPNVKWFLVN